MPISYKFVLRGEIFKCESMEALEKLHNYHDIVSIDCRNNYLKVLPSLPNSLQYLDCYNNKLTVFPRLPTGLTYLDCNCNKLEFLPNLPHSLSYFRCDNNNLKMLSRLPKSLTYLVCSQNKLKVLPELPLSLEYLYCWGNLLSFLPILPKSLKYKDYSGNPVDTYIREKCGNNLTIYHRECEQFATKLVNWYLDCRENPKFKFCRARLNRDYDALLKEDMGGLMA